MESVSPFTFDNISTNNSLSDNETEDWLGLGNDTMELSERQSCLGYDLISAADFQTFLLSLNATFYAVLSIFGMAGNVINIGVFIRLGIQDDNTSVTFIGLAFADFFYLLSLSGMAACWAVYFANPPGLNWDPISLEYAAFSRAVTLFSDSCCWITAFLAVERCLCVVLPFQVKTLFTTKRTFVVVISIFVFAICSILPLALTERLLWVYDPSTNRTKLIVVFTKYHDVMIDMTYFMNAIVLVLRIAAAFTIVIFSLITASTVSKKMSMQRFLMNSNSGSSNTTAASKIEKSETCTTDKSGSGDKRMTQKERKLIKMIITVSMIFVICCSPEIFLTCTCLLVPELRYGGRYHRLYSVIHYICFFLGAINSSVNVLIYFNMGTKYRTELKRWVGCSKKRN